MAAGSKVRNERLIALRLAQGWTQEELATGVERELRRLGIAGGAPGIRLVASWEDGTTAFPRDHYRRALRSLLDVSTDAELGFARRPSAALGVIPLPVGGLQLKPDMTETSYPTAEPKQGAEWTRLPASGRPQPAAQRVLRHIFQRGVEELFGWADEVGQTGAAAIANEQEWIMALADEAREHATDAAVEVPAVTVEDLHGDVSSLAHRYHVTAPVRLLSDALSVRNRVWRLLDRTRRPGQLANLYLVAGEVGALMAAATFDLGYVTAAEQQVRAARTYADLIDHRALRAWCYGLEAEAAYWTGRPRRARDLVDAGLAIAPAGTARARLYSIRARSWSYGGPPAAPWADIDVAAADAEQEHAGGDELHDTVGGHFSFGPARAARCHATTYVQLQDAAAAAEHAETALALFGREPGGWRLIEAEVAADLGAARMLAGDLDGAQDALQGVWDLDPGERREGLLHRLRQVTRPLAAPAFQGVRLANDLADRIEAYTADSIVRALPAAPAS
jgi:transcriptional regulator with XRE-family HTH domain